MSKYSRNSGFDKSIVLLILILVIVVVAAVFVMINIRIDPVSEALGQDSVYKVLFVLEEKGAPISISVMAYYPETHRAAMFDIPGDLGQIIKSLDRVDRLDVLYKNGEIFEFKTEIEKLMSIKIPFYITMNLEQFSEVVDLVSGIPVFIPEPVDIITDDGERILLPKGAVRLDGQKAVAYTRYENPDEYISTTVSRRQKAVMGLFQAINENSNIVFNSEYYKRMSKNMNSNLSSDDLRTLLVQLTKLDVERISPIRVSGIYRDVEGQKLLFPERDGATFREIVKQNFTALASTGDIDYERIYAIEVLNGTSIQDLAQNTGDIYQSFGFDVVRLANAEEPTDKTVVIDHINKKSMATVIADLIHCDNIVSDKITESTDEDSSISYTVDFTIILGSDFNGRYVIN